MGNACFPHIILPIYTGIKCYMLTALKLLQSQFSCLLWVTLGNYLSEPCAEHSSLLFCSFSLWWRNKAVDTSVTIFQPVHENLSHCPKTEKCNVSLSALTSLLCSILSGLSFSLLLTGVPSVTCNQVCHTLRPLTTFSPNVQPPKTESYTHIHRIMYKLYKDFAISHDLHLLKQHNK